MFNNLDDSINYRLDIAIEKLDRMKENLKQVRNGDNVNVATILSIAIIRDIVTIDGMMKARESMKEELRNL